MKVLTIKSTGRPDPDTQTHIHHTFGMEHHTDYVFTPRGDSGYSATIVLEDTKPVISRIVSGSSKFPDMEFVIDELDMEANRIDRSFVRDGRVTRTLQSGWQWEG